MSTIQHYPGASRFIGKSSHQPVDSETGTKLLQCVERFYYRTEEMARTRCRSGMEHTFDSGFSNDGGVILYATGLNIVITQEGIGSDEVSSSDTGGCDTGVEVYRIPEIRGVEVGAVEVLTYHILGVTNG